MRRWFLVLIAAALLVACGSTSAPAPRVHLWLTPAHVAPTPKPVVPKRAKPSKHRAKRKHHAKSGRHHPGPHARRHIRNVNYRLASFSGAYAETLNWGTIPLSGTTGYLVFQNGSQVADVTTTSYTFTSLVCATSYTLGVEAHDGSGNHSQLYSTSYTTPACGGGGGGGGGGTFPLSVSANGRSLQTAGGQPFLMVGDSPQSTLGNLSVANAEAYLDDRAAHGFTAVWFNLLCDAYTYCNADGTTFDGIKPFTTGVGPSTYDLSTPNPNYFARAHTIVAYAQSKGIEVLLDPAETGVDNQSGGTDCTSTTNARWMTTLVNNGDGTVSTTDKDYHYGQFVGSTFKDLTNILWMSGNDFQCLNTASASNDAKAVANGVRNTNPSAIQSMEPDFCSSFGFNCQGSSSLLAATGSSTGWSANVDLNAAYTYAPAYAEDRAAYAQVAKPMFLVESNYDQEALGQTDGCNTARNCRLQEWWTMTSGGTGQMYGCACTTHLTNANFPNGMDTTAVTQLGYQASLLNSLSEWQNLAPDTNGAGHLIASGGGTCPATGSIVSVTCVTAAETPDQNLALAYDPTGATVTVNFSKMAATTTARWWDPTNNTFTGISGSPFSTSATSQSIAVPGANSAGDHDWVLVLQANVGVAGAISCNINATTGTFATAVTNVTNGQTICLASGNYGTWNTYNGSSKAFTVAPQAGATPIMCFEFGGGTAHVTIDGGHTNYDFTTPGIDSCDGGSFIDAGASDITIKRMAFSCLSNCDLTGTLDDRSTSAGAGGGIVIGPENIFHDGQFSSASAMLWVVGDPTIPADSGKQHVIYNLFENSWPDSMDPGSGMTIIGNDFLNIGSPNSYPGHSDVIQFQSYDVIKGNFVQGTIAGDDDVSTTQNCTQGIANYDTGDANALQDNVIVGCDRHSMVNGGDNPTASTVDHNTVIGAGGEECGTKTGLGYPSPSLTNVTNNIIQQGINWGGAICTPTTDLNNMSWTGFGLISSASDFIGTPAFTGTLAADGYPSAYSGYQLTANSPGGGAATDGSSVGARVNLYPRPAGLP